MVNEALGYAGVVFSSLLFVPQLIHMCQNKKTKDVSYFFLALALITYIIWTIYGVSDNSPPIILSSVIAMLLTILMTATKIFYEWSPLPEPLLEYNIADV